MTLGPHFWNTPEKERERRRQTEQTRDMLTQAHDQEERPNQHGGSTG
jgi:hypothetical protein